MQLRTALLALIPGAAHIDLGRATRGLLWFALFAFLANGALVAPFVSGVEGLRTACFWGAAGVWIASYYGALRTAAILHKAELPQTTEPTTEQTTDQIKTPKKETKNPV